MARKDLPCAECGAMMWRSRSSAPEGVATCNQCRRQKPGYRQSGTPNKGARVTVWNCAGCGLHCEREPRRGQLPKWCDDCRSGRAKKQIECAHCGVQCRTWHGGRYCSRSCASAAARRTRALVHVGPSDFCWLPANHPVIRWASVLQARPTTTARYWDAIVSGPCARCGQNFTALSGTARYCSPQCSRNALRLRRDNRFRISPKKRLALYERDGWTCQLCMESVDRDLMVTDPCHDWEPSLDHIIPQSKGGGHDEANLRLVHRWCNAVRGAEDYHSELFAA